MEKPFLLALWDYDAWANERILAAAAGLTPEELGRPLASGYETIFATLWHMVEAAHTWRVRAETGRDPAEWTAEDVPDLAALAARSREESAAMRALIERLPEAQLAEPMRYDTGDAVRERPRWQMLVHLVNHGTHHRGELAAALTALGRSPGELDFGACYPSRVVAER